MCPASRRATVAWEAFQQGITFARRSGWMWHALGHADPAPGKATRPAESPPGGRSRARAAWRERSRSVAFHAVATGPSRRKPQPAQQGWPPLPSDSRVHPREREPLHSAVRHALQQDLSRLVQPVAAPRPGGPGPRHPSGAAPEGPRGDRVRPAAPMPAAFPGWLREKRPRRRLARVDAPVHGPPDAEFHPG